MVELFAERAAEYKAAVRRVLPDQLPGGLAEAVRSRGVGRITGTVILDTGPSQGRRVLTLLPDYHLCVVRADQIVATLAEGLARLDPARPRPGSAAHQLPATSSSTGSKACTAPAPWRF